MEKQEQVFFFWKEEEYSGIIEKEYENSFLIAVSNPCLELKDKYLGRIVVSKNACRITA